MSLDTDVTRSLREANRAWELFNAGMQAYGAHVMRYDWDAAEAEHLVIVTALDDYLDAFAAAKKRLQYEEESRGQA